MKNRFRTYDLAVAFYRDCQQTKLPGYAKSQLMRASLSIGLNLREGRGRATIADQKRFFHIAMGSARECQGLVDMHDSAFSIQSKYVLDQLAGSLYLLIQRAR